MTLIDDVADFIGKFIVDEVWVITLVLIIIAGMILIWSIDWPNFKISESIHIMRNRNTEAKGISTMGSFFVALSSRMGAGNIIGVAIAIIIGGPGAVLWMWLFSIFGAVLCFAECTLGQIFKEKRSDGLFRGGPAYYSLKGARSQKIANLFAVLLIIVGLIFGGIQACNMNNAIRATLDLSPYLVSAIIALAVAFIISIGLRKITKFISYIVPIFATIWIITVLITVIMHAGSIPGAISSIFSYGLGFESMPGAGIGILMITGFKRGAFCSEGGTGQISSVSSSADDKHPCVQGYMQAFGVYVDIFFICTMSALLLLTCGGAIPTDSSQAISYIIGSLETGFLGEWSKPVFSIILMTITFASIFGNYVFSESNTKYLFHNNKNSIKIMNVLFVGTVFFMSVTKIELVWAMGDLLIALLVIVNIYVIYKLYKYVSLATKDYKSQRKQGIVSPTFDAEEVLAELDTSEITEWKAPKEVQESALV